MPVVRLQLAIAQKQRLHHPLLAPPLAAHRPPLLGKLAVRATVRHQRLFHLADHRIAQQHHRGAVDIGQIEGVHGQVVHLLHGVWGQHRNPVAAVPSPFHRLEVVRLRGVDPPEPRAGAGDVDDDARQLRPRHIGDPLLFQRDTGTGRGGHGAHAAGRGSQEHVYGGHLALGLDELAADQWEFPRQVLRYVTLRGDRITEIVAAASLDGSHGGGLVPLYKQAFRHLVLPENAA